MAQSTVLIVDDDPAIRKMLVEMLSLEGFPTETATNGQEALDMLAQSGPRVILLDLLMPVVDGREVMAALQGEPQKRALHKIIFVSAVDRLETARDLNPDGLLAKPFTLDALLTVLEPVTAKV
ncbi:MAG: response regulator [Ktedonobacterales bacterium]